MDIYYGLILLAIGISLIAQCSISSTYSKYKKVTNKKNLSGSEAARMILDANGLNDIYVVETRGSLTDHYDPSRKVIRLSSDVFHLESVASVAVAAHECGHAIQDKDNYAFLKIRSMLVPIVNFANYAGYIAILIGIFASILDFLILGIALEIIILLFQVVTLPVEFNASNRALKQIEELNLLDKKERAGGKSVLTAAAFTYIAGVISTLLDIFRLMLIANSRRD